MSLMGYNLDDIHKMQDALVELGRFDFVSHEISQGLPLISGLLEGLIEEGRV